jgi:glycosyltransferase involved in cell wall biosynthesis
VKRFELLIDLLATLRRLHPTLEAVIVGEGYERPALEAHISRHGAREWLSLPGRVSDEELVGLYRRAWALTSCSLREGWGMTITEAAACGTPAVVTDIAGHRDAVAHGQSGLLGGAPSPQDPTGLLSPLDRVLSSIELRRHLAAGALAQAAQFTWDACARGTMQALADEAARRAVRPARP